MGNYVQLYTLTSYIRHGIRLHCNKFKLTQLKQNKINISCGGNKSNYSDAKLIPLKTLCQLFFKRKTQKM